MRRRRNDEYSLSQAFDNQRADYNAARASRFRRRRTGVDAAGSGADYHYRSEADYLRLMEQARDMDRNDVIAGQTVDRAVGNIVQEGFTLSPETGDKALDVDLWERWKDWSEDPEQCDCAGELSFYDFENIIPRSVFVDGDCLVLPLREGSLQGVEGHRLRTPKGTKRNVVHGVLLDEQRKRLQYWLTKDDIDPLRPVMRVNEIKPYPARDDEGHKQVFHVYNPKRISQTRGVTAFAPIFDQLGMFEDINFAKLVQQQIVSCFAIFRERNDDFKPGGAFDAVYGEQTTDTRADGSTRLIEGIGPGMEVIGQVGEKLQGFSPAVPNAEFFKHVRLILTLVGINMGLPLVLVLMDASETNFSGWRGAVDEARRGFRRNQKWLISRFHRPVYRWKLRQWTADDPTLRAFAEKLGEKFFAHRWNPPTWQYIEPLKDATADLLEVRGGLTSPRRLHGRRGGDFEEIADETVEDNSYAIVAAKKKAQEINRQFSDDAPVTWRDVLNWELPKGFSLKLDSGEKEEPANAE